MKRIFCYRKLILCSVIALIGIPLCIRYSAPCAEGIGKGIAFCTGVLIPSLFLFMVLTAYLIHSGAVTLLAKPFGWLGRWLSLPREAAAVTVLAVIGGYPIGAGCTALLYEQGRLSAGEAAKTALIAVAAGPGFIISYVGKALLGSPAAGGILLAAQLIAVLITGRIAGRTVSCSPPPHRAQPPEGGANALVAAVRSAADATFGMCAMVVVFSAVIEVLSTVADGAAADILAALLEVTTGCSRLSTRVPLYVTAFFIGFGGLSVHCQIYAALSDIPVRHGLFFLFRIIEGIIAAAATYIFLMITPMELATFSTVDVPPTAGQSATLAGSGALILASLCFIGSVSSKLRRLRICAESPDGWIRGSGWKKRKNC